MQKIWEKIMISKWWKKLPDAYHYKKASKVICQKDPILKKTVSLRVRFCNNFCFLSGKFIENFFKLTCFGKTSTRIVGYWTDI